MKKKPTIKDLAKAAGVSHTTISLVFSSDPRLKKRISDETRERVYSVARKLNYVPNMGASNLRKGTSNLIGFIVNDIANPAYGQMAQIAEAMAQANGYQLIIADHQWNPDAELAAIKKMIAFRARGLLWSGTEKARDASTLLSYNGGPAVIALDNCPRDYTGAFVSFDARRSAAIATEHLIANGVRHPFLFTVPSDLQSLSCFADFQDGFLRTLTAHGIGQRNQRVIASGLTTREGHQAFQRFRQGSDMEVDGILAINDACAYGVMGAASEFGLKVGRDLALVGVGNNAASEIPQISLTSVSQPPKRVIELAMNELFSCFAENRTPELNLQLPAELMIRNSSQLSRPRPQARTQR